MKKNNSAVSIQALSKVYSNGHKALNNVSLDVDSGEIFALLGPNGAGKTTLIGSICGTVSLTSGKILVDGYDVVDNFRVTRSKIGLVPQELTTDAFETVWDTVNFSRGLFGKNSNPKLIEGILKDLSLFDKKDQKIMTLSGGMKRRLLIAKALSHEPEILFLDEPTAGVDVDLRKGMWEQIRRLRSRGVTVILTTHYIQEAEEMADRIGIINRGKIVLVDKKVQLIQRLGRKELLVHLVKPLEQIPRELSDFNLELIDEKQKLKYVYNSSDLGDEVSALMKALERLNIDYKDLDSRQSSLEEIFVSLVNQE